MEPGRSHPRSNPLAVRAAAIAAIPGALAIALAGVGLHWDWFTLAPAGLLLLVAEGAFANVALFAAFVALRDQVTRRQALRAQCEQQLRHLAPWGTEEGVLRQVGLIRDLNAAGVAPQDLQASHLRGADLTGCDLRGADLRGADLAHANLQGALLDGADLGDANLADANLALASLPRVSARGAGFEGAALTKANLTGADFTRASLVNANVHGTDLRSARLERARFAEPDAGPFGPALHPSVDDWIRERLDARGCYSGDAPTGRSPASSRKAKAG